MKRLFFDGAFGTYYSSIYKNSDNCESACIEYPERVLKIHKEYINAGVNAIKTNSFGANRLLSENKNYINDIITQSFEIAKKAVEKKSVEIFCDIGYINDEDTEEDYLNIAKKFIEIGGKNFLFETLAEFEPIKKAVKYIKETIKDSLVIISFACDQNGYTRRGLYYEDLFNSALEIGDYVGLNCVCGPYHICKLIEKAENFSDIKERFSAMPNTSYPSVENGRYFVYPDNKDYYSDRLVELYSMGIGSVGGCCGSTPGHIKMFLNKIKNNNVDFDNNKEVKYTQKEINYSVEKSLFLERLDLGKKVIAVEVDSPVDTDFSFVFDSVKKLKEAGANIITIADSPLARVHADSFITAAKIKRDLGIDVLPHLTCRDRNHIGIKSLLLGANLENINNVLAVTGDPIPGSENKGTYEYNSFSLIEYISRLNEKVFAQKPFCICGALNVNSSNFNVELKRAKRKIEGGCQVFFTQPVFSFEGVNRLKQAKEELKTYILAGIMPIVSYKNAMFLNNEVFGINIPGDILNKFKDKTKEEALEIGINNAIEFAKKCDFCDGYYLMIPLKKTDMILKLIKKLK